MYEEVRSGVDWLSITLGKDKPNASWWHHCLLMHISGLRIGGYDLKERSMLGYQGWACGNCFIGEREDDYYCQLTGHHADGAFELAYRSDAHISRIDMQTTVKYKEMDYNVAREAYDGTLAVNALLPLARRRKIYIICGSDGGDTLYVGSPSSEIRTRLYNKEVQSEDTDYTRCWRYECVFRNDYATGYAKELYEAVDNRMGRCAAIVAEIYRRRGIRCGWVDSDELPCLPIIKTLPSDVEKRLWWLENQVKPAVRKLTDAGFRDKVIAALGLDETLPESV